METCGASRRISRICLVLAGLTALCWLAPAEAAAQREPTKRTESSCTFGMVKGDARRSCKVPIPPNCTVAKFPGSTRPWSNISKGGATTCRFNEKETDWKTTITGTCEPCRTRQCSARFAVVFDCS